MDVTREHAKHMKKLADEGKRISKIQSEDFPKYDYWQVYSAIYSAGGQSAQGIKTMIENRLNRLLDANKAERKDIVDELKDLTWSLYSRHKGAQRKLDAIRKALGE